MGFNCLKATEPLRGDSLLFTIKFAVVPGTQMIRKAELTLEPPSGFEPRTSGFGIQRLTKSSTPKAIQKLNWILGIPQKKFVTFIFDALLLQLTKFQSCEKNET